MSRHIPFDLACRKSPWLRKSQCRMFSVLVKHLRCPGRQLCWVGQEAHCAGSGCDIRPVARVSDSALRWFEHNSDLEGMDQVDLEELL